METLVLGPEHLDLSRVSKGIRNEVNRAKREEMRFREISQEEHEAHLRQYRRRKNLLMPPFGLKVQRKYYGLYTKGDVYCCSVALYPWDGRLVIQGVSIGEDSPYYAFSFLIYRCLELSLQSGHQGLDLAGEGEWKRKWNPREATNSLRAGRSLTGGLVSRVLAALFWRLKRA